MTNPGGLSENAITLPWPPRELSPNARVHWRVKALAAEGYNYDAFVLTKKARVKASAPVCLDITFHPPSKRRADLDNMFASLKHAIDGISEAIKVDDSLFSYRIAKGEPVKGGCVRVSIL